MYGIISFRSEKFCILRRLLHSGEMQEWFNWHAWKACVPQKGTGGSKPPLSAKPKQIMRRSGALFFSKLIEQNLFCEDQAKNKYIKFFAEKLDLLWLCWIPPGARRRQPPGFALALPRSPTTSLPCRLAPSLNPATGGILNARPPSGLAEGNPPDLLWLCCDLPPQASPADWLLR